MCGTDGRVLPTCRSVSPRSYRAAASSRPETNWDDAEASTSTEPPPTRPVPCTVKGRWVGTRDGSDCPSPVTLTPRACSAASTGPMGRTRAWGSPSKCTGPSASAATGGRKRMTVPARPVSIRVSPRSAPGGVPGATCRVLGSSPAVTATPRARSEAIMRSASRERSAPRSVPGPSASAASTSSRLVSDLLPGTSTVASSAPVARGADQASAIPGSTTGCGCDGTAGLMPPRLVHAPSSAAAGLAAGQPAARCSSRCAVVRACSSCWAAESLACFSSRVPRPLAWCSSRAVRSLACSSSCDAFSRASRTR